MPNEEQRPGPPLWLLAELTYACPLQCPYCSNPLQLGARRDELDTAQWLDVLDQARSLGATQLGFSGGEPLLRPDLERLIGHARSKGYYTNLITSSVGMDEARMNALKNAGLDHIQISFQDGDAARSDYLSGTRAFDHKREMARAVKAAGFPMVLNFVLHRANIDHLAVMLELAIALEADYVELANTQYYGWALHNRASLLPSREQLVRAEKTAQAYRDRLGQQMKIYYVVPDYYENRPKACMGGWGSVFLTIAPDGVALPCHSARQLPGIEFPNVRDASIEHIWYHSDAFNRFRGYDWMREPCRSCPEKTRDFGGCRCQAFLLTGDARQADPVCDKSPHHERVTAVLNETGAPPAQPLLFRNPRNSRKIESRHATHGAGGE